MQIAGLVVGWVLLGQVSGDVLPPPAATPAKSPAVMDPIPASVDAPPQQVADAAPTMGAAKRPRPADMVAEAMTLPAGGTIAGQPVTLLSVLSSTADRRLHWELTHAYWQLVRAVADYHFCFESVRQIDGLKPAGEEPASLRLARASASASLREAELQATRSQYELARLARLPAGSALPLPLDRPHAGAYRTSFQELFGGRTAPESAVLMERLLPIRRQAVDDQAAAVLAAEDALAAAAEQQSAGRGDLTAVIGCSEELLRQQRTLMRIVCEYNDNIADYGMAVAPPLATPQTLVAMLIKPVQQEAAAIASEGQNGRVLAAGAAETAPSAVREAVRTQPGSEQWKRPQPSQVQTPAGTPKNEPTLAPPLDSVRRTSGEAPVAADGRLHSLGDKTPTFVAPEADAGDGASVDIEDEPASPSETREANKPTASDAALPEGGDAASAAASPLYPALVAATPAVRAKQLTGALHWDRSLPEGAGKPMDLFECLSRDAGNDRRGTIEVYWRVRQRAAAYQTLVEQSDQLDGLATVALERRNDPTGAADMLRLQAAQSAARVELSETRTALVEAQFELAARLGVVSEAVWPLASTVPHSGSYLLKLDAQPQSVASSWPVRRLAATIPALGEGVQERATAVVQADVARVAAAERYRQGSAPIEQAIEGISAQTRQTLALLDTLADYNRTIADYVLTVTPPTTPVTTLVAMLVVKP